MSNNPGVKPAITPVPFQLCEASLADAMAFLVAATDVTEVRKQAWLTALRSLSSAIGRPLQSLPCRLGALRHHVDRINPAAQGWSEKTLANHKSNAKAALQYVTKVAEVPSHGVPLSEAWAGLLDTVANIQSRRLLSPLARYCSTRDISPSAVTGDVVDAYVEYREQATFRDVSLAYQRSLVRAWNRCVERVPGWPRHMIASPALPPKTPGPDWEDFPEGLRVDIETYLQSLTVPHRASNGKRWRGVKNSTLQTRREELVAFARRAASAGTAINSLTSLAALLAPDVVGRTFEAYLPSDGSPASVYVIDLAGKLLSIARVIGAPPASIARLDDIRARLEEDRGPALTEKNLTVIRQVMSTDVWRKVIQLPEVLMRQATRSLNQRPRMALSLATVALQIEILTHAPIRIGNLLDIRLDHNLQHIAGGKYRLHFPAYDVKNRVDLDFELTGSSAEMLDTYITQFRPRAEGKIRSDWLFPTREGEKRASKYASKAIARIVEKHAGLRVTAHQFRHAAATLVLKADPGNYEYARRVLGHRNIVTTQRSYAGLESFAAAKAINSLVEREASRAPAAKARRRKGAQS